jgi:hypothetical protein
MDRKIVVYGYGDKRPGLGFPTADDFRLYISQDIFKINKRRHRYTQGRTANLLVLSRKGFIHGHFAVDESVEPPNEKDKQEYPPVRYVYIVRNSALYDSPISLSDLGITGIQFGKTIPEEIFSQIRTMAGVIQKYDDDGD